MMPSPGMMVASRLATVCGGHDSEVFPVVGASVAITIPVADHGRRASTVDDAAASESSRSSSPNPHVSAPDTTHLNSRLKLQDFSIYRSTGLAVSSVECILCSVQLEHIDTRGLKEATSAICSPQLRCLCSQPFDAVVLAQLFIHEHANGEATSTSSASDTSRCWCSSCNAPNGAY